MKRRELTTEEREEAQRLANAWEAFKADRRHATQKWLGVETGLGNQSAVYQYLRGLIPLNLTALLAFCKVIGCEPKQISPRLAGVLSEVTNPQAEPGLTMAKTAREQLILMAYRVGGEAERTAMDVLAEQILKRAG